MKWYNVELGTSTKTMLKRVENFRQWLYDHNIKHETSGCFNMIHFEMLLSEADVSKVEKALDSLVWFDAIQNI